MTPPAKRPLAPTQEGLALRLCRPTRHDLDRRGTGLHRLTAFVEQYPEAFRIADVCTDQTGFIDWDELDASVRAATGHKSTATIVHRLTSPTHYAWYHTARRRAPFPPTERLLWDYLRDPDQQRFHTKAAGLIQALQWARAVLGLDLPPQTLTSPRIVGLAQTAATSAPPPKRAPALQVQQLIQLETICHTSQDLHDRAVAGTILFGIHSSARASDLARATSLEVNLPDNPMDTTWVHAGVPHSKTSIGARARLSLPLLAPLVPQQH